MANNASSGPDLTLRLSSKGPSSWIMSPIQVLTLLSTSSGLSNTYPTLRDGVGLNGSRCVTQPRAWEMPCILGFWKSARSSWRVDGQLDVISRLYWITKLTSGWLAMKFGTYLLLISPSVIKSQRTWPNFQWTRNCSDGRRCRNLRILPSELRHFPAPEPRKSTQSSERDQQHGWWGSPSCSGGFRAITIYQGVGQRGKSHPDECSASAIRVCCINPHSFN